jgi:hypothetical protein
MKKHLIYLFLFTVYLGFAQQEPKILVATDTTQIRIGEQFQYKISIDKKTDVTFPVLTNLGLLEVISSGDIDTLKNELIKKYVLTGFDSGSFYIPKQQLFIKDKTYFTDSLLINVANVKVDTVKQKAFAIKPIASESLVFDDFKPYFSWFYLVVGCLILLISMYSLFQKKSGKKNVKKEKIPAYQEAIQKFTHLDEKDLLENEQIKEYYIELTEIIRVYLGKEVNVHTLEATTDELIALIKNQNSAKNIGITKDSIQQLQAFLQHADFVKFAKLRPSLGEIQNDRNVAASMVEGMKPLLDKYSTEQKLLQQTLEKEQKLKKEFSFKKMSQRAKIFIAIIVFAVFVVGFFGSQIYENAQIKKGANSLSDTTIETVSDGWSTQTFGSPALTLTAPGTITLKSNAIPAQAQSVISELNIYSYVRSSENSEISVTTVVYAKNINPDVEQTVQSTLSNLEQTQKIEDLEFERQPAAFGDEIHGMYLKGSYVTNGTKRAFNLLGFSKENKVWQVFTNGDFDDSDLKTTMQTVVQSIKFEKE